MSISSVLALIDIGYKLSIAHVNEKSALANAIYGRVIHVVMVGLNFNLSDLAKKRAANNNSQGFC